MSTSVFKGKKYTQLKIIQGTIHTKFRSCNIQKYINLAPNAGVNHII